MAAVGLLLGVLALFILDMVLPHTHSSLLDVENEEFITVKELLNSGLWEF